MLVSETSAPECKKRLNTNQSSPPLSSSTLAQLVPDLQTLLGAPNTAKLPLTEIPAQYNLGGPYKDYSPKSANGHFGLIDIAWTEPADLANVGLPNPKSLQQPRRIPHQLDHFYEIPLESTGTHVSIPRVHWSTASLESTGAQHLPPPLSHPYKQHMAYWDVYVDYFCRDVQATSGLIMLQSGGSSTSLKKLCKGECHNGHTKDHPMMGDYCLGQDYHPAHHKEPWCQCLTLTKQLHNFLTVFQIVADIMTYLARIADLVPNVMPVTLGACDTFEAGMGDIQFIASIDGIDRIVSYHTPNGNITNSNLLELKSFIAQNGVLAYRFKVVDHSTPVHSSSSLLQQMVNNGPSNNSASHDPTTLTLPWNPSALPTAIKE
eukprot:jgi/Psemu1/15543/gm1.15543_g